MALALALLALVASASCVSIDTESTVGSIESQYTNQPVVVVRKTTYYEPELVAVVVERGVDDVPEDSFLIQNYADVLSGANKEIRLCKLEKEECLEKPVTRLLVPRPFKSLGVQSFFDDAAGLPWVSTLDNNVEVYNKPILVSRPTKSSPIIPEDIASLKTEVSYHSLPLKPETVYRTSPLESISYVPYTTEVESPRERTVPIYRSGIYPQTSPIEATYERPTQRYYPSQRALTTPVETQSTRVVYSPEIRNVGIEDSGFNVEPTYYSSAGYAPQVPLRTVETGPVVRTNSRPISTEPYYVQRKSFVI